MKLIGADKYWQAVHQLQAAVLETQSDVLDAVATAMVETVRARRTLFLFGTGHSHMLAEEGHFRAGSLAAFVPILLSSAMLHESAQLSGKVERTPGLAAPLLDSYHPRAGDILFIFSNSGVNLMPVEMALAARECQLTVVSVSSLQYARLAPLSKLGKRLDEVADYAIDNGITPGDAVVMLDGSAWPVAPASTLIGSFILNCLVAEVSLRLHEAGEILPVFASFNMVGAEAHNEELLATWGGRNPHL